MIKKGNQYSYNKLVFNLLGMSRSNKTLFVMFSDYLLLVLSFWVSLSIRANGIYIPTLDSNVLILLGPFIAIPIFYFFGLYRSKWYRPYTSKNVLFGLGIHGQWIWIDFDKELSFVCLSSEPKPIMKDIKSASINV